MARLLDVWFATVKRALEDMQFAQSALEPCHFVSSNEHNEIIGMTLFHVDDVLLAGRPTDPRWQKAQETLHACWQWGEWEVEKFKICGVAVEQASDGTIALSQKQYVRSLTPIELGQQRRQQSESVLTAHDPAQVRGLLGALPWVASQTVAKISAELGIHQSCSLKNI